MRSNGSARGGCGLPQWHTKAHPLIQRSSALPKTISLHMALESCASLLPCRRVTSCRHFLLCNKSLLPRGLPIFPPQTHVPSILQDASFAGYSVSLSIGVSTEKTVVGLLNELDTEYQIVGDAVTEAHLLATTFLEVGVLEIQHDIISSRLVASVNCRLFWCPSARSRSCPTWANLSRPARARKANLPG